MLTMFRSKKDREEHRYYLLPGMGRSNRHRHRQIRRWSIFIGLLVSALVAGVLYLLNRY